MSYDPGPPRQPEDKSVGELVLDVSQQVSLLVREEIDLAKAEISEKVAKLVRGSIAGVVAGAFAFLFLIMLMHALAWLLNDLFFDDDLWLGFLVESALWLVIAIGAGIFAWRSVQAGAPPVPEMAIEEARKTKETLEGGSPL